MVLDTSAVLAVLFAEPERDTFIDAIAESGVRLISSMSALESSIVTLARKGEAGIRELDLLIHTADLDIVPFDEQQMLLARDAYERYGTGRHSAGLNLGDCCSYALSKHSGEPLLFKGNDFAQTDIETHWER